LFLSPAGRSYSVYAPVKEVQAKKKPTGDSKDLCYQGEVVVATKILIIIIYGAAGSHSSAD
jgi:hypothetical protein